MLHGDILACEKQIDNSDHARSRDALFEATHQWCKSHAVLDANQRRDRKFLFRNLLVTWAATMDVAPTPMKPDRMEWSQSARDE